MFHNLKNFELFKIAIIYFFLTLQFPFFCEDRPPKFDPDNKSHFSQQWVDKFQSRHGLSIRRRTNKKKTSVFERLHTIHGFHAYCQYDMVFDDISSEEESSSE